MIHPIETQELHQITQQCYRHHEKKLPNEIGALSGKKFIVNKMTTYVDAFGPK